MVKTGLQPGDVLSSGQSILSPNGQYRLTMQGDGNLVSYTSANAPIWASGTSGSGTHAAMLSDGNLVVYNAANAVVWASGTSGHPGAYVGLGNDGELQIYPGPSGGSPLWAVPGTLVAGATLASGQSLFAPGGQYTLMMQSDGNLVEYRGGAPIWASGTSSPGSHAVMQGDGNLVVYSSANAPQWSSNTSGHAGSFLVVGDDGELTVGSAGSPLWAAPGTLVPGAVLASGQSLFAPGGQYTLTMQSDGNLVEYRGGAPIWASGTSSPGSHAVMQGDGNLVVYSSANAPQWSSNTSGHAGSFLVVGDDGELTVGSAGSPLWAVPGILVSGATLASGQTLFAPGGLYTLTMQGDGNLVEYKSGAPVWASGTNVAGSHAVMQSDGNLVVYNPSNAALWDTGTSGSYGAYLVLGDDGTLAIDLAGQSVWTRP